MISSPAKAIQEIVSISKTAHNHYPTQILLTKYNFGYTIAIMKTAISIPDPIYEAAEKLAQRLGISRSQLYTTAISGFIREHQNDGVTEKLNEIYAHEPSSLDHVPHALQYSTLEKDEW